MRKVRYFFNIRPFSEGLRNECITCVKETAEKMMEFLNLSGCNNLEMKKKYCQTVDRKLVSPLIDRISNFEQWLETSGILEIPDKLLNEYLHVISLDENSKISNIIDIEDDNIAFQETSTSEIKKKELIDLNALLLDVNSTIKQIEVISREIENLEAIWSEKKSRLNDILKSQKIVQIFGPMIKDLKTKHKNIVDKGTINKFQKLIGEFCIALEERNELRYSLVFGKESLKNYIGENKQKSQNLDVKSDLKSEMSQGEYKENIGNVQEKNNKRNTYAVDQNAMKLFARWSLPTDPN